RQRLLLFREALICLSYSGKMVVPAGNAPASPGYRPGALLLSYRTMAEGVGSAPTSVYTDPVFETGAASLYLPAFRKMAARVGLAPTPRGLTGRRATLTPPGNRNWRCRQDLHLHGFV